MPDACGGQEVGDVGLGEREQQHQLVGAVGVVGADDPPWLGAGPSLLVSDPRTKSPTCTGGLPTARAGRLGRLGLWGVKPPPSAIPISTAATSRQREEPQPAVLDRRRQRSPRRSARRRDRAPLAGLRRCRGARALSRRPVVLEPRGCRSRLRSPSAVSRCAHQISSLMAFQRAVLAAGQRLLRRGRRGTAASAGRARPARREVRVRKASTFTNFTSPNSAPARREPRHLLHGAHQSAQ